MGGALMFTAGSDITGVMESGCERFGETFHAVGKTVPQIEIEKILHLTDSVFSMEMHIPAGVMMGKEKHNYSHLSYLMQGSARLYKGDEQIDIFAPAILTIDAGVWHAVEAITDVIWVCSHAANETDVTIHE